MTLRYRIHDSALDVKHTVDSNMLFREDITRGCFRCKNTYGRFTYDVQKEVHDIVLDVEHTVDSPMMFR